MLLVTVWLVFELSGPSGEPLLERASISQSSQLTVHGRGELWSRALMVISDFPITGMGLNVFREALHRIYPPFDELPTQAVPHAHNGLLQTAVDVGLPGLIAYVAVWTALILMLTRVWKATSDAFCRCVAQGLIAGVIAQVVFQVADLIPLGAKIGGLWWVVLGLAAGAFVSEGLTVRSAGPERVRLLLLWCGCSAATSSVAIYSPVAAVAIGTAAGVLLGWLCAR